MKTKTNYHVVFIPASIPGTGTDTGHGQEHISVDAADDVPNARVSKAAGFVAEDEDEAEIIPNRRKTSEVVTTMEIMIRTIMIQV